ncbi:MAG: hypothetical protein V1792_10030 [Pseudomonadota bacterium]
MSVEQRIDDLIEAGWLVLDSDFDTVPFQHWRRKAVDCLTAVVGPDHVYTRQFENFVRQGGKTDLLAAGGILSAAKEQMPATSRLESAEDYGNLETVARTERIGGSKNRRAI